MNIEKAIDGIQQHRELIHKENRWEDPLRLSDSMMRLSVYNSYLADHIAELHQISTGKRLMDYKSNRDNDRTQGDSDVLSRLNSLQERNNYENTKYIYNATDKLIGTIQTKLKVIENQMKREGQNAI